MIRHRHAERVLPSRVVVMGASGFAGRDLTSHLEQLGIETVGVSSADMDLCRPESVEALQGLLRPEDSLVICSAITPDKGKDIRTFMKNCAMGEHLGAALVGLTCAHVVYLSSDAVYEDNANPVRESSCCGPSSFHGLMHLARERMLAHAVQRGGTPLLTLRPSLLYGARDTHNSYGPNRFLRTATRDRKITLFGQGEEKRDHVYIGDLSRLIGLCLTYRSDGVLNVATGRSVSFFDVAHMIGRLSEAAVAIECLPRATPVTHRHFDVSAMYRAFPSFRCTPLQQGLSETFKGVASALSA